eukprot:gene6180-6418_t
MLVKVTRKAALQKEEHNQEAFQALTGALQQELPVAGWLCLTALLLRLPRGAVQVKIINLLQERLRRVTVVGDDAQEAYQHVGLKKCLEDNYRCTPQILRVAKALLTGSGTLEKQLRPRKQPEGKDPVVLMVMDDEESEAQAVAETMLELHQQRSVAYGDMAVLFRNFRMGGGRTHTALQAALVRKRIPFVLVKDTSLFARVEVLDTLAYLKLTLNCNDDASLLRVINVPNRRLGEGFLKQLQDAYEEAHLQGLTNFMTSVQDMTLDCLALTPAEAVLYVVRHLSGFREHMLKVKEQKNRQQERNADKKAAAAGQQEQEDGDDGGGGEGNLGSDNDRQATAAGGGAQAGSRMRHEDHHHQQQQEHEQDDGLQPLADFVAHIHLNPDADERGQQATKQQQKKKKKKQQQQQEQRADAVTISTIHAAKGLEYDTVFAMKWTEGSLPGFFREDKVEAAAATRGRQQQQQQHLPGAPPLEAEQAHHEEEQRVAHVAVTRAKERLYLTCTLLRPRHWMAQPQHAAERPSRFLQKLKTLAGDEDTLQTWDMTSKSAHDLSRQARQCRYMATLGFPAQRLEDDVTDFEPWWEQAWEIQEEP